MSTLSLNSAGGLEPRGLHLPYVSLIKVSRLEPGFVHTCKCSYGVSEGRRILGCTGPSVYLIIGLQGP